LGAGDYEATAAELAPVAEAVVERARISAGDRPVATSVATSRSSIASDVSRFADVLEDMDA
jgi:hypothetical protein